jgi:hypothetical protein
MLPSIPRKPLKALVSNIRVMSTTFGPPKYSPHLPTLELLLYITYTLHQCMWTCSSHVLINKIISNSIWKHPNNCSALLIRRKANLTKDISLASKVITMSL